MLISQHTQNQTYGNCTYQIGKSDSHGARLLESFRRDSIVKLFHV